jgi:hypothetical protein
VPGKFGLALEKKDAGVGSGFTQRNSDGEGGWAKAYAHEVVDGGGGDCHGGSGGDAGLGVCDGDWRYWR